MRRRAFGVHGRVQWDDVARPVSSATISFFGVDDARPLGETTTDRRGAYAIRVRGQAAARLARGAAPVYVLVRDRKGNVLGMTRDTPVRLSGSASALTIDADAGRRRPAGRAAAAKVQVGPLFLDADAVRKATPDTIRAIARALAPSTERPSRDPVVRTLLRELTVERRTLCGAPVLETIEYLIESKGWPRELALEVYDTLSQRSCGCAAQAYASRNFIVTYYAHGPAAVDPDTSPADVIEPGTTTVLATLPDGGPPTYIKRICFWLERALAAYTSPPFALPNPAISSRLPVVVTDRIRFGNATPTDFYINNRLPPDLLCAVAVHELFHRVQYQFPGVWTGAGPWVLSMKEGGATWAEDSLADLINRYLYEAGDTGDFSGGPGVLSVPHKSLESASYKCSLFWRYVAEQRSPRVRPSDEPEIGVDVYRRIIEECAAGTWSAADVKRALRLLPWHQDFYEFSYLDAARQELLTSETTLGDYALACFLKDVGTDAPDRRFDFMEKRNKIFFPEIVNTYLKPPVPVPGALARVSLAGKTVLTASGSVSFVSSVPRFGSRYYALEVDRRVTSVRVEFAAAASLSSGLFQVVLIDDDGGIRDIYRSDRQWYIKQFPNLVAGRRLDRILIVVTGAASAGAFSLTVSPAAPAPDVMVTRWNSPNGKEYEIDPRDWAWTWLSPDLWVDNDGDGAADAVRGDGDNKLFVRLHNKGDALAEGISVQLDYQDASGPLSDLAWRPVGNAAGAPQSLTDLSLPPGGSRAWSVDWAPVRSERGAYFCVRAIVTAPGDPNTDNKRALSNFGTVVLPRGGFVDVAVRRRNPDPYRPRSIGAEVVPRLAPDLQASSRDLKQLAPRVLKPGEEIAEVVRLNHWPAKTEIGQSELPAELGAWHAVRPRKRPTTPDPQRYYPTDPRTLPPGVAGRPMITVIHTVDGLPLTGVSLLVSVDGGEPPRAHGRRRRPAPRGGG